VPKQQEIEWLKPSAALALVDIEGLGCTRAVLHKNQPAAKISLKRRHALIALVF